MQVLKDERSGKSIKAEVIDENCSGLDSDVRILLLLQLKLDLR